MGEEIRRAGPQDPDLRGPQDPADLTRLLLQHLAADHHRLILQSIPPTDLDTGRRITYCVPATSSSWTPRARLPFNAIALQQALLTVPCYYTMT
jgi:hypothetical protein